MVTGIALAERREPAHVAAREPADATPGRWVDARDLRVGDLLLRRTGELARIQGIGVRDARMAVSDLRVAELHNDAAGDGQILAHNPTDCKGQQKFGFRDEAPNKQLPGPRPGPKGLPAPKPALSSLDDVAAVMRSNLPEGMTPKQFGEVMKWGGGNETARARIATLTADELRQAGITAEMAENWAAAYEAVVRFTPANPSAAGRADLMRYAARLLGGG